VLLCAAAIDQADLAWADATLLGVFVPADGTRAATMRNGDFGTSPIFGQLSDKPLLAYISHVVCDAQRTRRGKKLGAGPNRRSRNPVVRQFNVSQN
jgi:hypothetical protein